MFNVSKGRWRKVSLVILVMTLILSMPIFAQTANITKEEANRYKAFHDTYDENDPDELFLEALDRQFYNVELDIMVDADHTTYSGSEYPEYLQGHVKLYVKHDAANWPNTRSLHQYFEDLLERIDRNLGSVHGDGKTIIVNIDMKTNNSPNYLEVAKTLHAIFMQNQEHFSFGYVGDNNSYTERAITVCLSGADLLKDAYFHLVSNGEEGKLLAFKDEVYGQFDGRKSNVADYFQQEADIYHRFYAIHWKHIESGFELLLPGNWSQSNQDRLKEMSSIANQKGYTVRFYSLNGDDGAWYYKFPNGTGEAAQRWTQFVYVNHKLGTNHYISTDSYKDMTSLFNDFLVPLRDYNGKVEKSGGSQNGADPSISITDDNRVIEVHKTEGSFNNNLWYSVGNIDDTGYIAWTTNERINPGGGNKNGVQPHSAMSKINGSYAVVQVNKTDGFGSSLWLNFGILNNDNTINWFTNERIQVNRNNINGEWPHIAIDGNDIILVYSSSGTLHYITGEIALNEKRVNWTRTGTIGVSGTSADVTMKSGEIIVVYRNNGLRTVTGKLSTDGTVNWIQGGTIGGQDGLDPTITFLDNNKVIEMHTSPSTGLLWYNIGTVDFPSIEWKHNYIWDSGASSKPRVAYNSSNNTLVNIHRSGGTFQMWYNSGKINYPN